MTSSAKFASVISGANIIAHGDGDGTIAAAVMRRTGASGKLTATQPFLLTKVGKLTVSTVVVDIAVDNKDPEGFMAWVRENEAFITLWVDHHQGGEALAEILGKRFVYDASQSSCPALMAAVGFDVPTLWVEAANQLDRPAEFHGRNEIAERYNSAFKVALVRLQAGDKTAVDAVQAAFVEELTTGQKSALVTERAAAYPVLEAATNAAFEQLAELTTGVVHVAVGGQSDIDMTSLMIRGYKKAPTVVVQATSAVDSSPITLVGTSDKGTNLVAKFGLGSGAPMRIVLSGGSHEEQLERVRAVFAGE